MDFVDIAEWSIIHCGRHSGCDIYDWYITETALMSSISVTTTDRRLTSMSPSWNSSLFIDDDIPVLNVVTDVSAEPVDSCCTVHCMLPQTTSNMGLIILMSVTDDQFLSFLHGRLLYLGLLLFSFYLLFSPFLLCSSFCLNLYKVGNNYVSPTHCCIFSGINWVVYSFLYWAVNLSEKLLYFCKTVTKFCSLVACIEWRQKKHTFAY